MSRDCDAIGCTTATASGRFMCLRHWKLVPIELQRTINDRYRTLRKDFAFLYDVTYLRACVQAVDHVSEREADQLQPVRDPQRLRPGMKVQTLHGEFDEDHEGNERITRPGSWGYLLHLKQPAPGEWHVLFLNGAAVVLTDAELRDGEKYRVLQVNPYLGHLVLAQRRAGVE